MTALNFIFLEKEVVIAMDTLVSSVDRTPHKFTSKILPIPHLRSVICGTGNLDLIHDWYLHVQRRVLSHDVDYFSNVAPKELLNLNVKYPEEAGTTTLYHFGYSEADAKIKGFVYRSETEFTKEEYSYCTAIKPQVEFDFQGKIQEVGLDQALIELMIQQKQEDDNTDEGWVGIGGEVHRFWMNKDSFRVDIIYRFKDYEDTYERTIENLC